MNKLVGYMEGTDPVWLTMLQVHGCNSVPLSNGLDGHGQNIRRISDDSGLDLIICYLHKLIAPKEAENTPEELLLPAKLYRIPVLVVCPQEFHNAGAKLLGTMAEQVELVDPANAAQRVLELLKK